MIKGETHTGWWRRAMLGTLSFVVAGTMATACSTTPEAVPGGGGASGGPLLEPVAATSLLPFGPDGFGHLTVDIAEEDALATGDLQPDPISTVQNRTVYSFTGGPAPDPAKMAEDLKLEDEVAKADNHTSTSAEANANAAQLYADSARRTLERMNAFLDAGGAAFRRGSLDTLAAPKDAATAEGIKRGSKRADLLAAYENRGLARASDGSYRMPAGRGWTITFDMDGDTVKFMSLTKKP
ncbi:hypothetical protein [Catenuloplanes japonicus]|uniref:hypothetical protein n=1 Tax=Catenuloplanes japonicus TaxID=33876 RepID=UPI0006922C98|nr:hypothetical protein [Catenuloplanes japonicus]